MEMIPNEESRFIRGLEGMATFEADEHGSDLGNRKWQERIEAVIRAAKGEPDMEIPWTAINLALIIDRSVRHDEGCRKSSTPSALGLPE